MRCSYPKYAGARGLRCRVSEGDALYTPSYWNHAVYSPPAAAERGCVNIGVNYWCARTLYPAAKRACRHPTERSRRQDPNPITVHGGCARINSAEVCHLG